MYISSLQKFYLSNNYPIIIDRKEIARLMNEYYKNNNKDNELVSCEIGVQSGSFSNQILQEFSLVDKHILVDCWKEQSRDVYNDAANRNDQEQENIYNSCLNNLKSFKNKIDIIRKMSDDACLDICDNYLDYLYIDGNHSYEAVKNDLNNWYPKMKKNSVISGHDYVKTPIFGVIQAVDEFCVKNKLDLFLTQNPKENISWFIFL